MEYGLDTKQFRLHIVRPTLQRIDLWNPAAENLVVGTCQHESHLKYVKQINGPACGFAQMEPATHDDIFKHFLTGELRLKIQSLTSGLPLADHMIWNAAYAVAMCRVHYLRIKEGLPPSKRADLLAAYWKRYYNTALGKGTVEQALPHFELAVKEGVL